MIGRRFGNWVVLGQAATRKSGRGDSIFYWVCRCDCGVEKEVCGWNLRKGTSISCGCARAKECKRGHDLTVLENTYIRLNGVRCCRVCRDTSQAAWIKTHPYNSRATKHWALKSKYGITLQEYEELVAKQGGRCGICEKVKPLVVDHNHLTNQVRGVICRRCNGALGNFGDSIEGVSKAINYLRGVTTSGNF